MEPGGWEASFHDIATLLPAYLNATLSEAERQQVEHHLATCAACRQELEEFSRLREAIAMVRASQPGPSPELFQHIKARIAMDQATEARQTALHTEAEPTWRERLTAWLQPRFARPWAQILATGLIAVQFAVIAGFVGHYVLGSQEPRIPRGREVPGQVVAFQSAQFQAAIQSPQDLGTIVTTHALALPFGFATSSPAAASFMIGTLYAESLAYMRSDKRDVVAQHLQTIDTKLQSLPFPPTSPLHTHLRTVRHLVESPQYGAEAAWRSLALFQPLYEEDAKHLDATVLPMFQAGSWLVDMTLAAAADDRALLRQAGNVQYLQQELQKLGAPQGALEALAQLGQIVTKPDLTTRDVKEILKLVRKAQTSLG